MILISVVVGYLLGIAPFIYIKLTDKEKKVNNEEEPVTATISNEVFNEWLYGEQKVHNQKNQQDLYEEYMTGEEVSKGE